MSKATLKINGHPWSRVFMKLFSTFDEKIVLQCQFYTGFMTFEHICRLRKTNFLQSLKSCPNQIMRCLFDVIGRQELETIAAIYNTDYKELCDRPDQIIYEYYRNEIASKCGLHIIST